MKGGGVDEAQEIGRHQFTQVQVRRLRNSNIILSVTDNLFRIRHNLPVFQKLFFHFPLPPSTLLSLTCLNCWWIFHALSLLFKGQSHPVIHKPWRNESLIFFLNLVCLSTLAISFEYISSHVSLIPQPSTIIYVKLVLCPRHWIRFHNKND